MKRRKYLNYLLSIIKQLHFCKDRNLVCSVLRSVHNMQWNGNRAIPFPALFVEITCHDDVDIMRRHVVRSDTRLPWCHVMHHRWMLTEAPQIHDALWISCYTLCTQKPCTVASFWHRRIQPFSHVTLRSYVLDRNQNNLIQFSNICHFQSIFENSLYFLNKFNSVSAF